MLTRTLVVVNVEIFFFVISSHATTLNDDEATHVVDTESKLSDDIEAPASTLQSSIIAKGLITHFQRTVIAGREARDDDDNSDISLCTLAANRQRRVNPFVVNKCRAATGAISEVGTTTRDDVIEETEGVVGAIEETEGAPGVGATWRRFR